MTTQNKQAAAEQPKRGPTKSRAGVQATLERITGLSPCPEHLRTTAYKYLDTPLFPPEGTGREFTEEKLSQDGAETLMANALALHSIFNGSVALVVQFLQKDVGAAEITRLTAKASKDVARRASTYTAALQLIAAASSFLKREDVDFRKERLDVNSAGVTEQQLLPAVQELERTEEASTFEPPDAKLLTDKADAFLALGDLDAAAECAQQANHLEPHNARAWFLRVVIALKRRNLAASKVSRHLLEATEVAEAMSAHERSAYEAADDAASELSGHQETLDDLVPQALLHWPSGKWGQFDHPDWRRQVCELMIAQAFRKVRLGGDLGESRRAFELNGLADEWKLKLDAPEMPRVPGDPPVQQPLSQTECEALAVLFAEHARYRTTFFDLMRRDVVAQDFKLLHLRWVLQDSGYEQHWSDWANDIRFYLPEQFERFILRSEALFPLWLTHVARHGGVTAAVEEVKGWKARLEQETEKRIASQMLDVHVLAFHHQYAVGDFAACRQSCDEAEQLANVSGSGTGSSRHPLEPFVTVPAASPLYWQYLRALTLVQARASGEDVGAEGYVILDAAAEWQREFSATERCFWTESEEYEGGGGEDYLVPPYNIDLRESDNWIRPTRDRDRPFTSFDVLSPKIGDT